MKIRIEKTPNVEKQTEDIYLSDLGLDIEDWEQMSESDKIGAISEYVNHPDSLANESFHFQVKIIEK